MATKATLDTLLNKLVSIETTLKAIPKMQKDISSIKKDVDLIKNCVSVENAKEFPALKRTKVISKGSKNGSFPIAAAPVK